MRLLTDDEVADQLNISKTWLQHMRGLERRDPKDRVPAWVDSTQTSWRPRVRGTQQSAVDEWLQRNTVRVG